MILLIKRRMSHGKKENHCPKVTEEAAQTPSLFSSLENWEIPPDAEVCSTPDQIHIVTFSKKAGFCEIERQNEEAIALQTLSEEPFDVKQYVISTKYSSESKFFARYLLEQ